MDGDGQVLLNDPIACLTFLFGGDALPCNKSADANDDGSLNIADPATILFFLFDSGSPLPSPYPACGADPTGDTLSCIGPISVCEPSGTGSYYPGRLYDIEVAPRIFFLDDLTGDGVTDFVSASYVNQSVAISTYDTESGLTLQTTIDLGWIGDRGSSGDINGDGVRDLVTANSSASPITAFLGDGQGGFGPPVISTYASVKPFALHDLNGDGFLDIIEVDLSTDYEILTFMGNGNGTFSQPLVSFSYYQVDLLTAVDWDLDGILDVVATSEDREELYLMHGLGDGSLQLQETISLSHRPTAITGTDLNLDGAPDLLIASRISAANHELLVLLGNGIDGFEAASVLGSSANGYAYMYPTDVNEDGIIDLITGGSKCEIFTGLGDGTFDLHETIHPGIDAQFVAKGDLDGSGGDELIFGSISKTDVTVHPVDTDSQFRPIEIPIPEIPSFSKLSTDLLAEDFDGDGHLDLAALRFRIVSILLGDGTGSFVASGDYPIAGTSFHLETGDLNSDGILDLVTASENVDALTILLGTGDGCFLDPIVVPTIDDAITVTVADLNGDGLQDIMAVPFYSGDDSRVHLGDGQGSFPSEIDIDLSGSFESCLSGDFNQDGIVDVAAIDSRLNVVLGTGEGQFAPHEDYRGGAGAGSMFALDLDFDGRLDILTARGLGIVCHKGLASGAFYSGVVSSGPGVGNRAVLTDLNGDGYMDVAKANDDSDDITLFLGTGGLAFEYQYRIGATSGPKSIAAGDFDEDGRPDLIVSFSAPFQDPVTVLLLHRH